MIPPSPDNSCRREQTGIMIFRSRYIREFGLTTAAAVCTIPIILAFLVFQKLITKGIAMTGLKG